MILCLLVRCFAVRKGDVLQCTSYFVTFSKLWGIVNDSGDSTLCIISGETCLAIASMERLEHVLEIQEHLGCINTPIADGR